MKRDDLIYLLERVYLLAFEAGVNSGYHYEADYRWGIDKYVFEKDIETYCEEDI